MSKQSTVVLNKTKLWETIMISNESDIKEDTTVDGVDINKHCDEAMIANTADFMQVDISSDLYFMPFISWHLMRVLFHCIMSNAPNKNLLFCMYVAPFHKKKISVVFDSLNKVVTQSSFPV